MRGLQEIRTDIADIDERILNLYKERMQLTEELVEYRLAAGKKIFDFTPVEAFDFKNARVVFQGVEGAYSQQALQEFFGADTQNTPDHCSAAVLSPDATPNQSCRSYHRGRFLCK